jgi:hypothetical protein
MTVLELWDIDLKLSRKSKTIAAVCAFSTLGLFATLIPVALDWMTKRSDRPVMNSAAWDRLESEAAKSYENAQAMRKH